MQDKFANAIKTSAFESMNIDNFNDDDVHFHYDIK